jgi:acyl dehydratase
VTSFERPFGRAFEDFVAGDMYRHWPGKTITEADDHLFCLLTMSHHPLHTDAWFAGYDSVHAQNVVVGNLVYSLAPGMSVADLSGAAIANLEVEQLIHRFATFHGDTTHAESNSRDARVADSTRSRRRERCDEGLQSAR